MGRTTAGGAPDVAAAATRIAGIVHRTPVLTSAYLDASVGAQVFLKCECFQKVGAFKARGALNAIKALDGATAERGVVTHSSGNHGQAVAWAAQMRRIPATVVMPNNSSRPKLDAVRAYGATVVLCEPGTAARERATQRLVEESAATLIHPYNDPLVIAGQGTAALELLHDVSDLDVIMTPVGGGGLLSGTVLAVKTFASTAQVFGAEPEAVDDAAKSLKSGTIERNTENALTIADGLRSASLGEMSFAIIKSGVRDILTVSEAEIVFAMRMIMERMKIVIEPSSAVPVAALMRHATRFAGQRVGIVITGGNVDLGALPWT